MSAGRPRKSNKLLPQYVRIRAGSYYYRFKKMCAVEDGMAVLLAKIGEHQQTEQASESPPDTQTIPGAVAAFKLDYLPTLSTTARKEHERLLDVFAHDFASWNVVDVEAPDVRRSIHNLYIKRGALAAGHHYKSRVSTFFRWTVEIAGLRKINPCREIQIDKAPKRKTKWTGDLFYAVRELLDPMHQIYHDLSFLLYQRTTDIRYLRRSQIGNGRIHFEPSKTLKSSGIAVDIPITPEIQAVLDRAAALSKKQKVVSAFVIHTKLGNPFTRSGVYSAYKRADELLNDVKDGGKRLGLNPKALRPFAATIAKNQGFSVSQLQTGLAHTTAKTTEGYIHQHETAVSQVVLHFPPRLTKAK